LAKSKTKPIDPEVVAILEALLEGWRLVDCHPDKDLVAVSSQSRELHESLAPWKELIHEMFRKGLIRDRAAGEADRRVCDFTRLVYSYVTAKGYKLYLAAQGLT